MLLQVERVLPRAALASAKTAQRVSREMRLLPPDICAFRESFAVLPPQLADPPRGNEEERQPIHEKKN